MEHLMRIASHLEQCSLGAGCGDQVCTLPIKYDWVIVIAFAFTRLAMVSVRRCHRNESELFKSLIFTTPFLPVSCRGSQSISDTQPTKQICVFVCAKHNVRTPLTRSRVSRLKIFHIACHYSYVRYYAFSIC